MRPRMSVHYSLPCLIITKQDYHPAQFELPLSQTYSILYTNHRERKRERVVRLMKRKIVKRRENTKMKGKLASHTKLQLGQVSLHTIHRSSSSTSSSNLSSRFQNLLDSEFAADAPLATDLDTANVDDIDFILSQDFFCTPDYITPNDRNILNGLDCEKENIPCPKSPEKLTTIKCKRRRDNGISVNPLSPTLSGDQQIVELENDTVGMDGVKIGDTTANGIQKFQNYVSPSAVALRCRVMPPPCIKNPYLMDAPDMDIDPFGNQRSKCAGFFPGLIGGDGLSRYHSDFQEIEQIGIGNFSRVFKVLKRIDGCLYAVKHCTRHLQQDAERRKALMEVQALAALGSHENVVGYYSSWFENEHLYIQMELCDHSLSNYKCSRLSTEEVLEALHQVAKALHFIHGRGIAHLDVKPDNIYVKNGIYKLGDFGCATLLDSSLPIEEGDARYMPQEILNEKYDHLDKVDIFSLGATIYELIRASPFPESRTQVSNLREGKIPLLPGHSLQLQNLLKLMVDPDPFRRPSAKELVENPIFDSKQTFAKNKAFL
ncbi:Pkinase domain-containing protein [Cephalotus follicularis]|uniref:Wee1-like protein kinase n=1 Tax=Cephalotus follicularis TaxID=3775 RepID=A0A1Q3D8V8_CEPFO|nr:Pkinase domain-containing protein [Cephalotus follicularis]